MIQPKPHEEKDTVTRQEVYEVVSKLASTVESGFKEMRIEIRNVERNTQPNYANVWQATGVAFMLIFALAACLLYYINQKFEAQKSDSTERFHLSEQSYQRDFTQFNNRLELLENINAEDVKRYRDLLNETIKPK